MHHGHRTTGEQYGKPDDGTEKVNSAFLQNCNAYAVHICIADSTNDEQFWHSEVL